MSYLARVATCYGLDAAEGYLVVGRSTVGRKGIRHEIAWEGPPAPEQEAFAALVSAVAAEVTAGRATVAGAMPVRESVVRWLTAPYPSVAKATKVLPSLLDIQLPFPLEACAWQCLDAHRSGEHVRALAVAARREDIQARLLACRATGLDPVVVDHEGLALWTQSLQELPIEPDVARVVCYVGHGRIVLVLGRGLGFESAHNCRVGLKDIEGTGPESRALREFAERSARVVTAHLQEPGERPLQWVWTGAGAEDAPGLERLERALALDRPAAFLRHGKPGSFLARAVAARALTEGPLRCNLRTGALAHPQQRRLETARGLRLAATYAALGLLLCGLNLGWRGLVQYRGARLQAALSELAGRVTQGAPVPKGQEALLARRALENRRPQNKAFLAAFRPSPTSLLADLLRTAQEHGMTLQTISLGPASAGLSGTSEAWEDSQKLDGLLRAAGYAVRIERSDAAGDERVHFEIRGTAADD